MTESSSARGERAPGEVAGTRRDAAAPELRDTAPAAGELDDSPGRERRSRAHRVFLLSPADVGGERARLLLRAGATFPLARAVQSAGGAPLSEVFCFASGLYFRGKLAYAEAFARPPRGVPGALVITSSRGLVPGETSVTASDVLDLAAVPIDPRDPRYREPLERDARALAAAAPRAGIVLLGSVASGKYVDVLLSILGERLLFPESFVGRGDMSRGGLLLRCVRAGEELTYVRVAGALRRGPRPPRLPRPSR